MAERLEFTIAYVGNPAPVVRHHTGEFGSKELRFAFPNLPAGSAQISATAYNDKNCPIAMSTKVDVVLVAGEKVEAAMKLQASPSREACAASGVDAGGPDAGAPDAALEPDAAEPDAAADAEVDATPAMDPDAPPPEKEWRPVVTNYMMPDQPTLPRLAPIGGGRTFLSWLRAGGTGGVWVYDLPPAPGKPSIPNAKPNANPAAGLSLVHDGPSSEPHPYVAWAEGSKVIVKKYESDKWKQLGDPFGAPGDTSPANCPTMIFDASGALAIAWSQGTPSTVHLRLWVDPQWDTAFTGPLDGAPGDTPAGCPLLALRAPTKLAAAWVEATPTGGKSLHVQRFVGPGWVPWGAPIPAATGATMTLGGLVLDGGGLPAVAWQEGLGGTFTIHVQRWDEAGKKWIDLGGAFPSIAMPDANGPPALAVDRSDPASFAPTLAWYEYANDRMAVRVWRLDGGVWTALGSLRRGIATGHPAEIGLAYGGSDPYLTFTDVSGANRALYAYYFK